MRLVGATIVRDASDIIEAFVRHNLTVLDGLAIVDHGSVDGTSEILAALVAEGLPVFLGRNDTAAFDQRRLVNRLVRHVFETSDADWIFPLDSDEFLKVGSRRQLEALLAGVPRSDHLVLRWLTYVPRFEESGDVLTQLRGARRLAEERHGFPKVAVQRSFASMGNDRLGKGCHWIERKQHGKDAATITEGAFVCDSKDIAIAHVPIRSARQFIAKFGAGWLGLLASGTAVGEEAFHWREAYAHLRRGQTVTAAELTSFALNYGVYRSRWLPRDAIELVEDPFLADISLRHTNGSAPDPFLLVLAVAERLLAERSPQATVKLGDVPLHPDVQ
jgi:hypothetical protein